MFTEDKHFVQSLENVGMGQNPNGTSASRT